MKISRNWLQTYFDTPLPDAAALSHALTFHAFEIDGVARVREDDVLDVKITANRGHDCLSHRGIAKEIAAILEIPMNADPLKIVPMLEPKTNAVSVVITDPALCNRFTAGYIRGVTIAPSPAWLKDALESIGQRSINNVVDATNFVMFNLGQPLHAFDAGKCAAVDGAYAFEVRAAHTGEKITTLDGAVYALSDSMLVVSDAHADQAVGIAGVKGGLPAAINESTHDIILEAAHFNGVSVRKTAAALKLRTDASARFEQGLSPAYAAYGMRAVTDLILELAGGELVGFADEYPLPQKTESVSVSVEKIHAVLGMACTVDEVAHALTRLNLSYAEVDRVFTIVPPCERLDIVIPEDLIEEVGRIIGYDLIPETALPPMESIPLMNENYARMEYVREHMIANGYSEVYTSVFAEQGERQVLNKVGGERSLLRANLVDGLRDALATNVHHKDLLGLKLVKIFEIGTVWRNGGEEILVGTAEEKSEVKEYALADIPVPSTYPIGGGSTCVRYKTFSRYPSIIRDIALWCPQGTEQSVVYAQIREQGTELLVRTELFDTFAKGDRVSYAFRLVFQSFERTLTDPEVQAIMDHLYATLTNAGFEIR